MKPLPQGPFDVIIADPPWKFASNSRARPGRNAQRHYEVMRLDDIAAIPVKPLRATNCALFMWLTGPMLVIGAHLPIFKAWGFRPAAVAFTWAKLNPRATGFWLTPRDFHMGGGFTTRSNAEYCLLGSRGVSLRIHKGVRELIVAPRREHSRKPDEFYERLHQYVGPNMRILELFARQHRPGITAWGNETEKYDADHGQPEGAA